MKSHLRNWIYDARVMCLLAELQRRKVYRVAAGYAATPILRICSRAWG